MASDTSFSKAPRKLNLRRESLWFQIFGALPQTILVERSWESCVSFRHDNEPRVAPSELWLSHLMYVCPYTKRSLKGRVKSIPEVLKATSIGVWVNEHFVP